MPDLHREPDAGPHGDDTEATIGTPRWVKAFGIVAVVLVLAVIGIHLAGGGLGAHMHTP